MTTFAEEAQTHIDEAVWYEVALRCKPREFYDCLTAQLPESVFMYHHFYEPWFTEGPVARVLIEAAATEDFERLVGEWNAVSGVSPWDREDDDRTLYGDDFLFAMQFFQGASLMAYRGERMTEKLVHCLLNAHGLGIKQEIRFGLQFLWHRLTITPRLKWREIRTGKKWWER